ncbi:MAG: hypothetical protein DI582_09835 [Azospirillum brasilense]|nr:MAG: hypothetical protein DI582_09835 [Azospirillum brasilense]
MAMSPEDHAAFMTTMAPVRALIKSSIAIVIGSFVIPLVALLLPATIGSILFVTGYVCYTANKTRIAEGKTSFIVRTRGFVGFADMQHRMNQSGNVFYMAAGGFGFIATVITMVAWFV